MSPSARPDVVLRAASGPGVGVGHVRRCRSIAQAVAARGGTPRLVVDDERTARALRSEGWQAVSAASEAFEDAGDGGTCEWLDGFRDWTDRLERIRSGGGRSVLAENRVARDLADDVVYPALHWEPDPWDVEHAEHAHGGAAWIPLSREILRTSLERTAEDRDIDLLVTFGGSDPKGLTERVLGCLVEDRRAIAVTVGSDMGERGEALADLASALPDCELVEGAGDLSPWMARSRCAVTAVATTLYELAWLEVPARILANYPEDREALAWYGAHGPHRPLGVAEELDDAALAAGLAGRPERCVRPEGLGKGAERIAALLLTD